MLSKEIEWCPLCPDERVQLAESIDTFTYKGEVVSAVRYFYKCHTCEEEFTTTESDTVSLDNIKRAYDRLHEPTDSQT